MYSNLVHFEIEEGRCRIQFHQPLSNILYSYQRNLLPSEITKHNNNPQGSIYNFLIYSIWELESKHGDVSHVLVLCECLASSHLYATIFLREHPRLTYSMNPMHRVQFSKVIDLPDKEPTPRG